MIKRTKFSSLIPIKKQSNKDFLKNIVKAGAFGSNLCVWTLVEAPNFEEGDAEQLHGNVEQGEEDAKKVKGHAQQREDDIEGKEGGAEEAASDAQQAHNIISPRDLLMPLTNPTDLVDSLIRADQPD